MRQRFRFDLALLSQPTKILGLVRITHHCNSDSNMVVSDI